MTHPRPVVDREAVVKWVAETLTYDHFKDWTDEQFADAVLALLPTEEGEGACICPTNADVTVDMRNETGQHLTGCPLSSRPTEDDTKALVETGTRLGYELGRKEAGEEIAAALEAMPPLCHTFTVGRVDAVAIARNITSQPQEAPSEPLTAPTGHSDLPEGGEGL